MKESAMEQYKQILDIDPTFSSARLSLAKLYLLEGRREEAIDFLDGLLERFPPAKREFVCLRCGHKSSEPLWRCPSCREWSSFNV